MSQILQFKIKLIDSKPLIWRRVQMRANKTFWDLHMCIQCAMDWMESQVHYFKIVDPKGKKHIIKSYLDDYNNNKYQLSWNISIKKYFKSDGYKIFYIYGTNNEYVHSIILEKTLYQKVSVKYPICLAGRGITDEEDDSHLSAIAKYFNTVQKFKVDNVVIIDGDRALKEHKVKLFDSLYQ